MIDHQKFQSLVQQLYTTVKALEDMFPGRHFTPDGHLVGSLGECLRAVAPQQWAISNLANQTTQAQ